MLDIRSIAPTDLEVWARIDDRPDGHLERSLASLWERGLSRPEWCFVAEDGGRTIGRLGYAAEPAASVAPQLEYRVIGLWLDEAHDPIATGLRLLDQTLPLVLPPEPVTVDAGANPGYMAQAELRRTLLPQAGFTLFQEKEGFLWTAASPPIERPDRLVFRSIEDVGQDRFAATMSRTVVGTLDRNDRYYRDLVGVELWGPEMLGYLTPDDAPSWLLASTPEGEIVGFVLIGAFDEPGRATIVHIGVVPEMRGRGYIDDLLAAGNEAARGRGFDRVLSDVDVQNLPMIAAMERAGHSSAATPWHLWQYRLAAAGGSRA